MGQGLALVVQSDGRLVVAGAPPTSTPQVLVLRYLNPAEPGLVGRAGDVYAFGDVELLGNAPVGPTPAVDLEPIPTGRGYLIVDEGGHVFARGDDLHRGGLSPPSLAPGERVTSISTTWSGGGYWIFTTKGRVAAFRDARHFGDMNGTPLNLLPVLDSVPTPSGMGYFVVAADGGNFAFGDARFVGSMGGRHLNAPVPSLVPDRDGNCYRLQASDGGIFAF